MACATRQWQRVCSIESRTVGGMAGKPACMLAGLGQHSAVKLQLCAAHVQWCMRRRTCVHGMGCQGGEPAAAACRLLAFLCRAEPSTVCGTFSILRYQFVVMRKFCISLDWIMTCGFCYQAHWERVCGHSDFAISTRLVPSSCCCCYIAVPPLECCITPGCDKQRAQGICLC